MTTTLDAPDAAPTIDTIVARALGSAETLYEEATVAWAAGLPELELARLRARLKERKIGATDFCKVVTDRRRASRVRSVRGAVGEDGWRATLKQGQWGEVASTFGNLCLILRNTYGERLSYNLMASTPCLDGRPLEDLDVSGVRYELERAERVAFSAEDVGAALAWVGFKDKPFHPVRDYLTGLAPWDGENRLDKVASRVLGTRAEDRLSARMVLIWFVALVARAMSEESVKADYALVLFSKGQGLKKSTFFKTVGGKHYGEGRPDITNRHGVMILHKFWVFEIAEIDALMRKHDHADAKRFVSQEDDTIVPMFGRAAKTLRRSFMAGGSTNQERLLTDVTGDRRWLIVETPGVRSRPDQIRSKIDLRLLTEWRDQLFAEALHTWRAYEALRAQGVEPDANPHRWWLSDEEEEERERRTIRHRVEDTWEETVGAWLAGEPVTCGACKGSKRGAGVDPVTGAPRPCWTCNGDGTVRRGPLRVLPNGREYITSGQVLTEALAIPAERHPAAAVRLAGTMATLGWTSPGDRQRRGLVQLRGTVYLAPLTEEQRVAAETRAAVGGDPDEEPLPAPAPTDPATLEAERREEEEARAVLAQQAEERRAERERTEAAAQEAAELEAKTKREAEKAPAVRKKAAKMGAKRKR